MGSVINPVENYQKRLDACNRCVQACHEYLIISLTEQLFMESQNAMDICRLYADLCEYSSQDCELFQNTHCKNCAEICDACPYECNMIA